MSARTVWTIATDATIVLRIELETLPRTAAEQILYDAAEERYEAAEPDSEAEAEAYQDRADVPSTRTVAYHWYATISASQRQTETPAGSRCIGYGMAHKTRDGVTYTLAEATIACERAAAEMRDAYLAASAALDADIASIAHAESLVSVVWQVQS